MDLARPSVELHKQGRTTPQRQDIKLLTLFCHTKRVNPIIAVREPMESILTPTFQ